MRFDINAISATHPFFMGVLPLYAFSGGGGSSNKRRGPSTASKAAPSTSKKAKSTASASNKKRASPTRSSPRLAAAAKAKEQRRLQQLGNGTDLSQKFTAQITQQRDNISSDEESDPDLLAKTQEVENSQPGLPREVIARNKTAHNGAYDGNESDSVRSGRSRATDLSNLELQDDRSPHEFQQDESPDPLEEEVDESNRNDGFDKYDSAYDSSAHTFSFSKRLEHYMGGEKICAKNRTAVENAVLCEAASIMMSCGPMKTEEQAEYLAKMYSQIIQQIPDENFINLDVKSDMETRRKGQGKEQTLNGANLKRQYTELRSAMRKVHINGFPSNFADIPSGKQLGQLFEEYTLKAFADAFVSYIIYVYNVHCQYLISLTLSCITET